MHPGVRDPETRLVDLGLAVEKEVEIEGPGALGRDALPDAAEAALHLEQEVEQGRGGKLGLELRDAVEKPRLVDEADRLGLDEAGDGDDLDGVLRAECSQRAAERLLAVAEVRAESDVGPGHGFRAYRYPPRPVRRRLLIALVAALCACGPAAAATGKTSDDPLQGQEWWLAKIGADQVTPPGPGVPITIVDSGVDPTHPEFAGRPGTSFLNDQTVNGPGEFHGTAVASIAAAPANGAGIVGVYPQAVLQSWDASPIADVAALSAIQGINTAAQHCPGVINLSFGGADRNTLLEDAILGAVHNGCLVVASSGNDGQKGNAATYPASFPHVLTVGATDENDAVAPFSSLSAFVDLAAPGIDIVGAVPLSHDPSGYSTGLQGTSFSAPMVSAAAAWVWTARPTLGAGQVAELLRLTARDVGLPGRDTGTGFGVVNIPAALSAATPPTDPREPNDDIVQVKPGGLFADGEPALTTATKPSNRISASIDSSEDPRDLYRIWVPAHRVVRTKIVSGGEDAAVRIWGPKTLGVDEGILQRRRDLKGPLIRGTTKGFEAYAEVLLTGRKNAASYVLSVTASKR